MENKNVYVGHRYVPKIMGEHDKTKSYEGLSIVTHEGNSYTSKKRVPIGVDISNTEYWVVTGNYNAQIEYYRDDVKRYKDETKKIVGTPVKEKTEQSILDAIESIKLTGGKIVLLEGEYLFNKSIVIDKVDNIEIVATNNTILKRNDVSISEELIKFTNSTNITIDNIDIDMNVSTLRTYISHGFTFEGCQNIKITNGKISNSHILETINKVGSYAKFSFTKKIVMKNNQTQKADLLKALDCEDIEIIGNKFGTDKTIGSKNCIVPVYTDRCKNVYLQGNELFGATLHDGTGTSHATGGMYYAHDTHEIRIIDNKAIDQSEHFIYFHKCNDVSVSENEVRGRNAHVKLRSCVNAKVSGNTLDDKDSYLIQIYAETTDTIQCENIEVFGNKGTSDLGLVRLNNGAKNISVKNNTLKSVEKWGRVFMTLSGHFSYDTIEVSDNRIISDLELSPNAVVYVPESINTSFIIQNNKTISTNPNFKISSNSLYGNVYLGSTKYDHYVIKNNITNKLNVMPSQYINGIIGTLSYTFTKGTVNGIENAITSIDNITGKVVIDNELVEINGLSVDTTQGFKYGTSTTMYIIVQKGGGVAVDYLERTGLAVIRLNLDNNDKNVAVSENTIWKPTKSYMENTTMQSPDGSIWKQTIDNSGVVTWAKV